MSRLHSEIHLVHRSGWLRAAVLGANDGIVSTASLIIGVAAAEVAQGDVLIAGFAALVAGAMSMALLPFTLASAVGRGARFFLVAGLSYWGRATFGRQLMRNADVLGSSIVVLLVGAILVLRSG